MVYLQYSSLTIKVYMINKDFKCLQNKKAFTLAEVLITLVIIGVIAAITVPLIIVGFQKEATLTRLKKTYSTLAQTTNRAIADNGPVASWEIIGASNTFKGAMDTTERYLTPYLSTLKKCESYNETDCHFIIYGLHGQEISNTNKAPFNTSYLFYLADGTLIATNVIKASDRNRIIVTIDINGKQPPNRMGRDIFRMEYYLGSSGAYSKFNGKFVPTYVDYSRADLLSNKADRCNKKQNGDACFSLIMKDNWQIKPDYPW